MRSPERREAKDGTVTWKVRYRAPKGDKVAERSETFALKSDAETFSALMGNGEPARVAEALAWLARKRGHDTSIALTFGAWFDTYTGQLTGVTSRTRDDYRRVHDRYLTHLDDLPLTLVTRTHVTELVNSMEGRGLSPKTIKNTVYGLLAPAFDLAIYEGLVDRNPTKRVRLPAARVNLDEDGEDIHFLNYEEFARLHAAHPEDYRPFVAWLVGTGMRWSEATALQVKHVHLDAGTAVVRQSWKKIKGGWEIGPPKSPKSRRTVNVATAALVAVEPLLAGRKSTDYVFTTVQGKVVRHSNFYNRIWVKSCERADLLDPRPAPHDLRDTHASWLLSNGISLEAVQDQLGHESILTTRQRYAHLLPAVGVEVGRVASAAMEKALAGSLANDGAGKGILAPTGIVTRNSQTLAIEGGS